MVVYSVQVVIDAGVVDAWTRWMKDTHIPAVLATGFFLDHQFGRMIESPRPDGRCGFRIDYRCHSIKELESYQQQYAAVLQADHTARFGGQFAASREVIELLNGNS